MAVRGGHKAEMEGIKTLLFLKLQAIAIGFADIGPFCLGDIIDAEQLVIDFKIGPFVIR